MRPSFPDPKSLSQLMVVQNRIPLMDSDKKLFALVNRGLSRVPGIAASAVHLSGPAKVPPPEGHLALPIETVHERFGWLDLMVREVDQFVVYEPFVRNLAGIMALWLDNHTRQRRLEEALKKIEQALHEREAFLAIASHDLGNPLAAIVNVAQALKEPQSPERVNAAAHLIERSARRMTRMIRDLLDLANIDAGRFSVLRAPQDVDALIAEAMEEVRAPATCKEIHLEARLSGELPVVMCDGERVAQVLSNLLGNAIKFTPRAGTVTITSQSRGHEVLVSVSDTGPGIARDDLPHVFERFYRGKDASEGGTGLGLAIAKAIIELHSGQISVESQRGEGTRFTFSLPAVSMRSETMGRA
jgi:signal transduction histidine kinase